jgi:hypothetical protein
MRCTKKGPFGAIRIRSRRNAAQEVGNGAIQLVTHSDGLIRNRLKQAAISELVIGKQKAYREDKHQPGKGHCAGCVNLTPTYRLSVQTTSQFLRTLPSVKRFSVNRFGKSANGSAMAKRRGLA